MSEINQKFCANQLITGQFLVISFSPNAEAGLSEGLGKKIILPTGNLKIPGVKAFLGESPHWGEEIY
ncbi:MAG: hypothetical protein MJZ51_00730 [Bacteroidales bacterium]|nr:hypothetical protein [Bacteroidales bacterium]